MTHAQDQAFTDSFRTRIAVGRPAELSTTALDQAAITAAIASHSETFAANHIKNQNLRCPDGSRRRALEHPMDPVPLQPGHQVKFLGDRRWWTVQAANSVCAVLTRSPDFGKPGAVYTVIVWAETRRGPQFSWGLSAATPELCADMAAAFAAGRTQLSESRAIYLALETVRAGEPR